MRSIHSHTALVPESATNALMSNVGLAPTSNSQSHMHPPDTLTTVQIDENNSISFKYAALSPSIIIVGTNKNLVKAANKDEYIRKTFERIKEFVSTKVYAKHIVEPFFAIDSLAGGELNETPRLPKEGQDQHDNDNDQLEAEIQSVKEVEKLRRVIELVAMNEPYMGEQLPLKWMNFEKSLEKLKNKGLFYASLSQVRLFRFKINRMGNRRTQLEMYLKTRRFWK